MKIIKYIVGLVLVAGFAAFILLAPPGEQKGRPAEGTPAPLFSLQDLSGKTWNLSALRGSVVMINFWATWCRPCREEMPSIDALNEIMRERDDFVILEVLYQDTPEKAAEFMKKNGYGLTVVVDSDEQAAESYGITGIPETFVIDKKGILRRNFIGPSTFDTPSAVEFFRNLLAEDS
jgi:peroxiredoxin